MHEDAHRVASGCPGSDYCSPMQACNVQVQYFEEVHVFTPLSKRDCGLVNASVHFRLQVGPDVPVPYQTSPHGSQEQRKLRWYR